MTFGASLFAFTGHAASGRVGAEWWWDKLHPADRRVVVPGLEKAVKAHKTRWSARYRIRHVDGHYIAVSDHLILVHDARGIRRIIGCARRTLRGRAKGAPFTDGKAGLRAVVDALPHPIWSADPDGAVGLVNHTWVEFTGQRHADAEGWGWLEAVDPTRLTRLLSLWRRAISTGEAFSCEVRLRRGSDHALRWHVLQVRPVLDGRGSVVQWTGAATDVHAIKQKHSQALTWERRSRRTAETVSRAKDEFLAVVSHELRTPLNAILGWAQLVRGGQLDEVRRDAAMEKIERNAFQQTKLIEDLLDVARIISNKLYVDRAPIRVGACVRAAVEALQQAADLKQVRLEVVDETANARVLGSSRRLEQVFLNLVSNAIKFSQDGMPVRIVCTAQDGSVVVRVTDYGKGIPPELLSAVFERFRQADESSSRDHGGLGLGLAISRHLVEMHRGKITAESLGLGRGATFIVTLPACAPDPGQRDDIAARRRAADGGASLLGVVVLVVDDNADAREVAEHVLTRSGANVVVAGSGTEALQLAAEHRPDVILTDIAMPKMDGYQLVRALRSLSDRELANVPVVALSAHAGKQDKRRARDVGFDEYIVKPVESALLVGTIANLLAQHAASSKPAAPHARAALDDHEDPVA